MISTVRDSITVQRVYADPIERDGVLIIPAASVGGGGGGGQGRQGPDEGEGAGFGAGARPVGAFVVKNGSVSWVPAVDVTRIVKTVFGALVAIAYLHLRRRR
ncbi:spore germination protein GerW family protein [Amycolatopsis xylanica]|nr:spore germination protein GerW family protein [Amycolatopsis xylanica]